MAFFFKNRELNKNRYQLVDMYGFTFRCPSTLYCLYRNKNFGTEDCLRPVQTFTDILNQSYMLINLKANSLHEVVLPIRTNPLQL